MEGKKEMTTETLTEVEIIGLRWMRKLNEYGIGYLGPTTRRGGQLPEYERLVATGLAKCVVSNTAESSGYWILGAGVNALAGSESGGDFSHPPPPAANTGDLAG